VIKRSLKDWLRQRETPSNNHPSGSRTKFSKEVLKCLLDAVNQDANTDQKESCTKERMRKQRHLGRVVRSKRHRQGVRNDI